MQIWKIIFLFFGALFLLIALVGSVNIKLVKDDVPYNIGLMIGSLLFFLPALLFFYLAYRQHKRIQNKRLQKTFNGFLESRDEEYQSDTTKE